MMVVEIIGGLMFGSIALVADGLHMGARKRCCCPAPLAYNYARRHANDARFTFSFPASSAIWRVFPAPSFLQDCRSHWLRGSDALYLARSNKL